MLKEIEREIARHFSLKWSKKDILFWMGKSRFDIDVLSLDKNLREPIKDFILRGGKRWRPILFLTTLKLLGLDWKKYIDIAFAIELAHNATLIIDDIEDSADLRRGKPTCHKIFGVDIAVNAGNTIYFLPIKILQERNYKNNQQKLKVLQIYSEEMINVHFGQALDITWHRKPHLIKIKQYMEMTRLKTGGLIRMAGRMACVMANKENLEKNIIRFSELAGIAFQIKDDALELESSEEVFGKSFGNDISEGKISLPVIFALQELTPNKKDRLLKILSLHTKEKELLKEAVDMIKESGAVGTSLKYADNLIDSAWQEIEIHLPKNRKEALEDFKKITYFLVKRSK